MKKVIVTKLSRAIRHVVSRGAQGPRGGLWGDWSEIPGKPDFNALYDPHGAASAAQGAAAADATAKVNAHTSAPDPHPQYALDTDLSGHAGDTANPHGVTKDQVGLGNVDNTSDASKPVSTAQQSALNAKEPTIAAGTSAQFWRGDKTWADFPANVRMTVLTGLSTASASVITAADSVLGAIGKLQAQISDVITQTEAETGTSTTRRSWTSQRVRQATAAWWLTASSALGRTLVSVADAAAGRTALGLGSASVLAAGQSDANLPTNSDIRAYYGSKFNPGVLPTFEMDFENARFSLYDAGDSGVYSTSRHFDEFAAWFGTDMQITRASTQTYFDALGNMREAPVNTVRCDHDPLTGRKLGVYVGGSRVNQLYPSSGFSVSSATSGGTIARGLLSLTEYTESTATTTRAVSNIAGTGFWEVGVRKTLSCYAMAKVGSAQRYLIMRDGTTLVGAVFNLATGAVHSVGSGWSATSQDLGGGLFRMSATYTNTGAAAVSASIVVSSSSNPAALSYTGDGISGAWLGGVQGESGSTSPLIVTTASEATRAATTVTVSGTKFSGMFNAGQGTFVLQYSKPMREAQLGAVMSVGDGTTQNRMYFLTNNSSATVFDYFEATTAGVAQGSTGFAATAVGRAAFSYANNSVALGKNGVSYTDSTFTVPAVNKLDLGHRDGASQINGHLTCVTYYPVALSTTPVVELAK